MAKKKTTLVPEAEQEEVSAVQQEETMPLGDVALEMPAGAGEADVPEIGVPEDLTLEEPPVDGADAGGGADTADMAEPELPPAETVDSLGIPPQQPAPERSAKEIMSIDFTALPEEPAEPAPVEFQDEAALEEPVLAEEGPVEPEKSDRQLFYELDFRELDRHLTPEQRQEWNSIYASYRGRSALSGTIIGVDRHSIMAYNPETDEMEREDMYCAIVVPYRVRIVIPASEMWEDGQERPDFVLQNMVGSQINFIIIKVDRESGFAIASRKRASRVRRLYFSRHPALHGVNARIQCQMLAVGPRRCLVECYGHDIDLTQRELRYTAIPDLRTEYHPGQALDCIVKSYAPERNELQISVKEIETNPFDGAEFRHPVGSRRQAVIAGKYGGGVFCNLPDGTVCMCNYSYQHTDSDFMVGDMVMLVIQRYEDEKRQVYGKILSKW